MPAFEMFNVASGSKKVSPRKFPEKVSEKVSPESFLQKVSRESFPESFPEKLFTRNFPEKLSRKFPHSSSRRTLLARISVEFRGPTGATYLNHEVIAGAGNLEAARGPVNSRFMVFYDNNDV